MCARKVCWPENIYVCPDIVTLTLSCRNLDVDYFCYNYFIKATQTN